MLILLEGVKLPATSVSAFEAKNTFSELLEKVGRGAEITITKHDRPVARLVPAGDMTCEARVKAAAELRAMSKRYSLKGVSILELVNEGRR